MKTFKAGQYVGIPCHIQKGTFPHDRLVTVETKERPYSGFVCKEYLFQRGTNPAGYIIGAVKNTSETAYTLMLPGNWFISGTMDFSADWVQKNAILLQLKESDQMQTA